MLALSPFCELFIFTSLQKYSILVCALFICLLIVMILYPSLRLIQRANAPDSVIKPYRILSCLYYLIYVPYIFQLVHNPPTLIPVKRSSVNLILVDSSEANE